jgi:hypothetical protein
MAAAAASGSTRMDMNDLIAWVIYMTLLQLNGWLEPEPERIRLAFVGDAIPGATYGG